MRAWLSLLPLVVLLGPANDAPAEPARAAVGVVAERGWVADPGRPHGFYFIRAIYHGVGYWPSWRTDSPKADLQLNVVLRRLLPSLDLAPGFHPVSMADPELRRYPFLYSVEVGHWRLSDDEVAGLRSYLAAGGFLFVDDFWGTREWADFEQDIRRVLPGRPIVELPLSHPVFHTYYDIRKVVQVPNVDNACSGRPTWEQDGYVPSIRGIFDDAGRLMVLIDWNSDMGDAWEWAEQSCYALDYSTYAFRMTVNAIVYAMSH